MKDSSPLSLSIYPFLITINGELSPGLTQKLPQNPPPWWPPPGPKLPHPHHRQRQPINPTEQQRQALYAPSSDQLLVSLHRLSLFKPTLQVLFHPQRLKHLGFYMGSMCWLPSPPPFCFHSLLSPQ